MSEYYVRLDNGSDDNTGDAFDAAFKTIGKAASVVSDGDVVHIYAGLYLEGDIDLRRVEDLSFKGHGKVVIDALGGLAVFSDVGNSNSISGVEIRNPSTYFLQGADYGEMSFYNCTLACTGEYYQVGGSAYLSDMRFANNQAHNCKFYGIGTLRCGSFGTTKIYSSLIEKIASWDGTSISFYDCAGDSSEVTGDSGCWSSVDTPAPYVDISDPANPDLSYNPGHANYNHYMTNGSNNGMVGNVDTDSVGWVDIKDAYYVKMGLASDDPASLGSWKNYEAYYNTQWQDIVIATGVNDELDFEDVDGVELTAVIAPDTYINGALLAAAVQTAIENTAGVANNYSVVFGTNGRFTFESDGPWFDILSNTGTSANPAYESLGFDITEDKTGASTHESDYALAVGASGWAEAGAVPATVSASNQSISMDSSYDSEATNCFAVSPVLTTLKPQIIKGISVNFQALGSGAVDSTPGDGARTAMVRASNAPFLEDDAPATTQLDWTHIVIGMVNPNIDRPYKYWQYGLMLRTNAV